MFRRSTKKLVEPALQRNQGTWLFAAVSATLAPHVLFLPYWVSAFCLLLLLWRVLLLKYGKPPPRRVIVVLLGIAGCIGVYAEFGYFFGMLSGTSAIALLLCLKLLETNSARDIRAAVLVCFFLQLAVFMQDQSIPFALVSLLATFLSITCLLCLNDPRGRSSVQLRAAARMLAQSLPVLLLLFILFPRAQGPLWGLPADSRARTGLSETMTPGSISDLAESHAIAFKAEFDGPVPEPQQRYWRGPVLDLFDGTAWRPSRSRESTRPFYRPNGPRFDYRITIEPHQQNWLLALDYPATPPDESRIRYTPDFRAISAFPLRQRARFHLFAYPETAVGVEQGRRTLTAALALPPQSNPRTRALVKSLVAEGGTPEQTLQKLTAALQQAGLAYTLRPPLLGQHAADEFLFDTKRGFCEHFASTFAFMARAANIPARVVIGYQGGEINPVDGFLVVRQSDAHAWTEVWLANRGWVRMDPTAIVTPVRIDQGTNAALPGDAPLATRSGIAWLRQLNFHLDAVINRWNQWVLGYDRQRQREFLERFRPGNPGWLLQTGKIALFFGALLLAIYGWTFLRRRRRDPLEKLWNAFSARLAKRGLARHSCEGPLDYGERLAAALPEYAARLREIAEIYARLRYHPPPSPVDMRRLETRIRTLKLP